MTGGCHENQRVQERRQVAILAAKVQGAAQVEEGVATLCPAETKGTIPAALLLPSQIVVATRCGLDSIAEAMGEDDEKQDWALVMSFWIDTDAYTKRDRDMFVAGVEFQQIYSELRRGWIGSKPVHRENESRLRMMCGRLGVQCKLTQHKDYEGCEVWSDFEVKENNYVDDET